MGKFCKGIAVAFLIIGILGSLVLAGTSHVSVTTSRYYSSYTTESYNVEYALTGIIASVLTFTLLYGFGILVDCAQNINQNLNALVESRRRNEHEESHRYGSQSQSAQTPSAASTTSTATAKHWTCTKCGYRNTEGPGNTHCKSCNAPRNK